MRWRRQQVQPGVGGVEVPLAVRKAHQGRHWRGVSLAELRARWESERAAGPDEWPTEQIPRYVEAAPESP